MSSYLTNGSPLECDDIFGYGVSVTRYSAECAADFDVSNNAGAGDSVSAALARREYILEHILRNFELNRIYFEKEVNEVITCFHDNYCRVRREFVDEGMMSRKDGKYRRNVSYAFSK